MAGRLKLAIKYSIIAFAAILLAEIFIFNFSSIFHSNLPVKQIDLSSVQAQREEAVFANGKVYFNHLKPTASLIFSGQGVPVESISFVFSGTPSLNSAGIFITDEQYTRDYKYVGEFKFSPQARQQTVWVRVRSTGNLSSAMINFVKPTGFNLQINAIYLNKAKPFNFSFLRFFLLLFAAWFIILTKTFGWHKIVFDPQENKYKLASAAAILVCVITAIFIFGALSNPLWEMASKSRYPFTSVQSKSYDPYLLVFDAFQKGHANIDIVPPIQLSQLLNPYYADARAGINYLFDYAFHEGKYYVYYGLAPVLFIYYPVYAVSGFLPSVNFTAFALALFAILFIYGAYKQLVKTFLKQVNLLLYLFSYVAIVFGSFLFMQQADAFRYELPMLSMYAALSAAVMFSFAAYNNVENKRKYIAYLALAGLSVAVIPITRPNALLMIVALLAPLYAVMFSEKSTDKQLKIYGSAAFLIPVFIGAVLIAWYNAARFGSIFDFGLNYNLSYDYVVKRAMSLANIPAAIYYYFFDFPDFSSQFPFITAGRHFINTAGVYMPQAVGSMGIFAVPLTWLLFFGWKKDEGFSKNDKLLKTTFWLVMAVGVFIAFYAFSKITIYSRYSCDIRLPVLMFAGLFMLNAYNNVLQNKYASNFMYKLFMAFLIVSIFIGFAAIFSSEMMWIQKAAPGIYMAWHNLIVF